MKIVSLGGLLVIAAFSSGCNESQSPGQRRVAAPTSRAATDLVTELQPVIVIGKRLSVAQKADLHGHESREVAGIP